MTTFIGTNGMSYRGMSLYLLHRLKSVRLRAFYSQKHPKNLANYFLILAPSHGAVGHQTTLRLHIVMLRDLQKNSKPIMVGYVVYFLWIHVARTWSPSSCKSLSLWTRVKANQRSRKVHVTSRKSRVDIAFAQTPVRV